VVVCSTPLFFTTAGWVMSFIQALVILRLIIFAAALESWVLTTKGAKRAVWVALALSALWIGLESWQQYLTGTNIFGNPRWGDGSLTGPFWKPRAGALYAHILYVALLPPVMILLGKPGRLWAGLSIALAGAGAVTSVLIGQRMGTAYSFFGLLVAAWLLPQLRRPALIIAAVAAVVLLALPLISPQTHAKLVGETSRNFTHYTLSPYGELETRATVMGMASPWHGWGYNGFRAFCPEDRFSAGLPALGIAPTELALAACNLHPHNYYLQAFTDAGIPGLVLFSLLNLAWLTALARGLRRNREPVRVGLLISVLTFAWPFASTDEFPTLYMLGWLFLVLGLGLSFAHITRISTSLDMNHV
jgi:O-antigen ligase